MLAELPNETSAWLLFHWGRNIADQLKGVQELLNHAIEDEMLEEDRRECLIARNWLKERLAEQINAEANRN